MMGAFWYNFFAATGEYFYHANLRTPPWMRFLIETPELLSIHHQYNVHRYNFSDIALWDRLFGTYKDATEFSNRCGFPTGAEQELGAILAFKDVYREKSASF
jgi:sterol desaturase/sphingolipid hydroxylase (fatty acid hydroxylase superfamily)